MKFIVNGSLLSKRLQSIGSIPVSKGTLPILDNFLFKIEDKTLTVKASDLENSVSVSIPLEDVEIQNLTTIALPAKLLLDASETFTDVPLTFIIDEETFIVEIRFGEGKFKMLGCSGEDFPSMPFQEQSAKTVLPASVLVCGIDKTLPAVDQQGSRPQMTGVFFEMKPEYLTLVGTDAHKLSRYRRHDFKSDQEASFIFPKKPLMLLKNILSRQNEDIDVTIYYNATNSYIQFGDYVFICRLTEGRYPNYEAAIPTGNPNRLEIDRMALYNALRRVAIFASQATNQIQLSINNSEVFISSSDTELVYEGKERVPCTYEGEPMDIGFNASYLIDMVGAIDTEKVAIELSSPTRAGILLPVFDEEKANTAEDILLLVMPLAIN